jgi:hypothetical protein
MAGQGTAELDFGAFPGASDVTLAITGQAGILANSLVEAWILPAATADHSPDEHIFESLAVMAHTIVPGTGFSITAKNTSQINEPLERTGKDPIHALAAAAVGQPLPSQGGMGTRLYGRFNVAWVWN